MSRSIRVYGMLGPPEQRVGRRHLDQAAEVHHAHARGDVIDDREVVADEEIGELQAALQVDHQVQDLRLHRDVERRGRLVAHQELRMARQRAGDRDALALAAGEFVRILASVGRRQPHLAQALADLVLEVGLVPGRPKARIGSATMSNTRQRGLRLAYGSWKIICMRRRSAAMSARLRGPAMSLPSNSIEPAGRRIEADHQAGHRRLAAARFAHQREGLALGDLDVDAVDRLHDLARPAFQRAHQPGRRRRRSSASALRS